MRTDRNEYRRFNNLREDRPMYSAHRRPCKKDYPSRHWLEDVVPPTIIGCLVAGFTWLVFFT